MPPAQCPHCGRFLKKAFVASLADVAAPCPGCGSELTAGTFAGVGGGAGDVPASPLQRAEDELHGGGSTAAADGDGGDAGGDAAGSSVRPPDLPPEAVRDEPADVLSGWDAGLPPGLDGVVDDRPPFPTDTVVVAGAGLVGLLLGASLARDRRAVGATTGALAGIVGAAAIRRIWRLDT